MAQNDTDSLVNGTQSGKIMELRRARRVHSIAITDYCETIYVSRTPSSIGQSIGLRNRRLEVRILWGVLKLMKVVGVHSGGLHLFQLRRRNCNQVKGLAKFDGQLSIAPGRVRKYEIE